jgi:exopolyphosphatase/guanosine-5'-triphosphate,3'-diphosphate pyrophosphatase
VADAPIHAAIDIGTNSIHLVVARVGEGGGLEILTREKDTARLGSGSGDMRLLTEDSIDRGIAALQRFRLVAETFDADISAVATSAVREAANRQTFIERARLEAGIDVQVISGVEEARLIHLGVLQAVPVFDQQILLVDIGGGSTELLVGIQGRVLGARSVKLGAIRVTDSYFPGGKITPKAVSECRAFLRAFLSPVARDIRTLGFEIAVGSSGTISNIAEMVERRRDREPTRWVNNVEFSRADLGEVIDDLLMATTTKQRQTIDGLDPKRADIIVGGALVLESVFDRLNIDSMVVSEYALREGVLLDRAAEEGELAGRVGDIRADSVSRLVDLYQEDRDHVQHATRLALSMFDQLAATHGLGPWERTVLEVAGLLQNVGLFISHSAHHKHSYYVIRHTDQLVGFTEHELELIALVARYHRRSAPKASHPEFMALAENDRERVRILAGILRIAIALDRTRSGIVESVRCTTGDEIVVECELQPGADAMVELFTAEQRKGLLEAVLDRPVVVSDGSRPGEPGVDLTTPR